MISKEEIVRFCSKLPVGQEIEPCAWAITLELANLFSAVDERIVITDEELATRIGYSIQEVIYQKSTVDEQGYWMPLKRGWGRSFGTTWIPTAKLIDSVIGERTAEKAVNTVIAENATAHGNYIRSFLTQAEVALNANRVRSTSEGFSRLPHGATQEELTNHLVKLAVIDFTDFIPKNRVALVKGIATQISTSYFTTSGYSAMTTTDLKNFLGHSPNTLETGLSLMAKTGIWGKVSGQGHTNTHYYSLLTEDGYKSFLKVVEDAHHGIHPLFGT